MPEAGKSRQVKGRQKICICWAVNDKEGGRVGGGKVAACNDSKEKVWYGDVWDEAWSSRLRKS